MSNAMRTRITCTAAIIGRPTYTRHYPPPSVAYTEFRYTPSELGGCLFGDITHSPRVGSPTSPQRDLGNGEDQATQHPSTTITNFYADLAPRRTNRCRVHVCILYHLVSHPLYSKYWV